MSISLPSRTGLSGVYNIMDHYEHEQKRAVEYVSTMHKAMNGARNFPYYSPTQALKQLSQDKLNRYVKEAIVLSLMHVDVYPAVSLAVTLVVLLCSDRVPPFTLLHGTSDAVVPVESSARLSELLTSLSITVSLYLLPGVDHTEIVTDLMASDRRYYHLLFSCIKLEHRKLLGPCRPIK